MAYGEHLKQAARRNFNAANVLYGAVAAGVQPGCRAVAGYLYGLTGEIAVKQMMLDSGIKALPVDQRKDDPHYAHFPSLKTRLIRFVRGRRASELRLIAEDRNLFQDWNVEMRYRATDWVSDDSIARWKKSAENLVAQMGLG